MDRKPTASSEAPPDCMYSRCGCCQKVEKLTAEIEELRKCLQFYADGEHMGFAPEVAHQWEDVSGEPTNWLQNNRSEHYEMIENGGLARKALAGEKIDWSEFEEENTETTKVCVEGNAGSEPAEPFKSELQDAGFLPQTERPQWIGVDYGKDKSVTAYRCTYCKQVFVNEPPEHHECKTEQDADGTDAKWDTSKGPCPMCGGTTNY